MFNDYLSAEARLRKAIRDEDRTWVRHAEADHGEPLPGSVCSVDDADAALVEARAEILAARNACAASGRTGFRLRPRGRHRLVQMMAFSRKGRPSVIRE